MENCIIRRLRPEDADDINLISTAITNAPAEYDFKRMIEDQSGRSEDASFVAEREGRVVGYLIISILSGFFGIRRSAWISLLGVHPRFMGKRIGERLAEEGFKYCQFQGIKDIYTRCDGIRRIYCPFSKPSDLTEAILSTSEKNWICKERLPHYLHDPG